MLKERNRCVFVGNAGKTPLLSYGKDGRPFTFLGVAVDSLHKDSDGEWVRKTQWVNVAAFQALAELIAKTIKKGDLVLVVARYTTREVDGETRDSFVATDFDVLRRGKTVVGEAVVEEDDAEEEGNSHYEYDPPF